MNQDSGGTNIVGATKRGKKPGQRLNLITDYVIQRGIFRLLSLAHFSKVTLSPHVLSRMCYSLASRTLWTVKLHAVQ